MRSIIVLSVFATAFAHSALADTGFRYGWMTGQLPGTQIIAANVVREPAFSGAKDEQVQAMDKAKAALQADYCEKRGGEFVADPGLIVFDRGINEWLVGGVCR